VIKIKELTKENLGQAIRLVCSQFPPEDELERADRELPASFYPKKYKKYLEKTQILGLKYWVAEKAGKVVGVVGLYYYRADSRDKIWLGWFVVDPTIQNNKLGTKLLEFVKQQARVMGKKILMVYTVPEPERNLDTRGFFEKNGFRLVSYEPWKGGGDYTSYRYQFNLEDVV